MSAEDVSRRGVIEGATVFGAAALVAPQRADAKVETKATKDFLAPATYNKFYQGKAPNTAPVVSTYFQSDNALKDSRSFWRNNYIVQQVVVHDERGCLRPRNEYTGAKSGTEDDEMCVQVKSKAIAANTRLAEEILSEFKTWSGIVSQKK